MSDIVRAANGQFVALDYATKYPLGRKHCASCKCWRHVVDFSPAKWIDRAKTIPLKLMSYCRACVAEASRIRKGSKGRRVFDGQVGTPSWHATRLAKKRARYREQRKNPFWVQARRDAANERTRRLAYAKWAKPIVSDRESGGERLDPVKFVAYLDQWTTVDQVGEANTWATFINGFRVTDCEGRQIRRWRRGENRSVRLWKADEWAIRFDLPFWEIEEVAAT